MTAAVQLCLTGGEAVARQADAGDAISALLLGPRGPPPGPGARQASVGASRQTLNADASAGDAVARYLVTGQRFHAPARNVSGRAGLLVASNDRPPCPARAAPTGSPGDRIEALLTGGVLPSSAPAQPPPAPRAVAPPVSAAPPRPVAVTTTRFPPPDPQTLLLLQVQLDDLNLTDGMAAYGIPEDPQLPVGELSRLLELDVDVRPSDGRITGNIGESRRALTVDLTTNTARIGPVQIALAPDDVVVEPGDIFVRASVLSKLLPLTFQVDPRALQMKLHATEVLPLQGRLQRLARLRQGVGGRPATPVMRVDEPYHLISPPSFDVILGVGAQNLAPRTQTQYDVRVGADLLDAGLQAEFGSDQTGRLTTGRVLLEKRSLDGDLLGPLHARQVDLGDVYTPALAIGPRSLGGRGMALSTVPLDQTNVFNRIDLRGQLPVGDDVELYVNDVLQGTQNQAANGQYEFLAVPLVSGVNVVRIVFYGPHGERREETRVVNAGGGLLKPGQFTLEFGAVDQDQPLLHIDQADPFVVDHFTGKARTVLNLNYGVTSLLTASLGGAVYTDQLGVERQLVDGGLRTSIAGFASELDIAADDRGGEGASIDIAGRIFGTNTVLRHSEYRGGLLDENNTEADIARPLQRRTELDLDRNVILGGQPIPLSVRALRDVYEDGGSAWITQVRGSASLGSILYSNGLEYDHTVLPAGQTADLLKGFVSVSTFRNYQWQVRGTLDYNLVPDVQATAFDITADRTLSDRWSLRLGATAQFLTPTDVGVLVGTTTKTKFGDLTLTGQYDTNSNWRFGAQMNFGIGYDPQKGYEVTRPGPGSGGSVAFHAFIDANGNGVYDPGEKQVANVTLEGGSQKVRTDADGRAYLSGFGAAPTARLLVGIAEIDDQQVKTPPTVIEFSPRPGGVTEIEYPMRPTGEVMVSVKLRRPDKTLVGLSATRVRLVDSKGVAVEAVTEFDGGASFIDLPAATYHLELDKEQAARLHLRLTAPVTVTIKPDGSFTPDAAAEVEFEPRPDTDAKPPGSLGSGAACG